MIGIRLIGVFLVTVIGLSSLTVILPTRASAQGLPTGPWVDELVWTEQPDSALALEQIKSDGADLYMFSLRGATQKEAAFASPDVLTFSTHGTVHTLLLNPNDQVSTEPMNPFADAQIREAMNWLIDREEINREIMDGFAIPYVVPFHPRSQDYFREIETFNGLENQYQADFSKARDVITQRMLALGASIGPSGYWEDSTGKVIELKIVAPVVDERLDVGNYVAGQLGLVDFQVTVDPSTDADAVQVIYGGDPSIGNWHIFAEGWAFTANVAWFDDLIWFFHNCVFEPFCARFGPPGTYNPPADFDQQSEALAFGRYTSLAERQQWIRELTPRALEETNYRMLLQAEQSIFPVNDRIASVVLDPFGGPWTTFTLKTARLLPDQPGVDPATGIGGSVHILNIIAFIDAWNPWISPGWLPDAIQRQAISDPGMWFDPQSGRWIDYRVETAVETAGPIGTLPVPGTAVYYDTTTDQWAPVGPGVTAQSKVTTRLPDNPGKWHTGTDISMDDLAYSLAAGYRRATPGADVRSHDDQAATAASQFHFSDVLKGAVFVDDHTLETYLDFWHVDDREIAGAGFWYAGGTDGGMGMPWEIQEALLQSVINDETAIHEDTATSQNKIWLDVGRNPDSIAAIDRAFAQIGAENGGAGRIPAGMSPWITQQEATARYQAAQTFRNAFGHWAASNGPFLLQRIDPFLKQTVMVAHRDGYPFQADHWDFLKESRVPDLTFGPFPSSLLAGTGATLTFDSSIGGQATDAESTRWFIRELATGFVVLQGEPVRTGVGEYEAQVLSTQTVGLETGGYELVVIVQGVQGSEVRTFAFTVQSQLDFFQALFDELENRLAGLSDQTTNLGEGVRGVQSEAETVQILLVGVVSLVVIALVALTTLLFAILRRIPPPRR